MLTSVAIAFTVLVIVSLLVAVRKVDASHKAQMIRNRK